MKKRWMLVAVMAAMTMYVNTNVQAEEGTYAEDGSYIADPETYYGPVSYDEEDDYLVMVWVKTTTNNCGYRTNSYTEANNIASYWQAQGYAAAVIHNTASLEAKMPYC